MKTKPLIFLFALSFLFLFSGSVYGQEEVKKEYWNNGKLKSEKPYNGLATWWYETGGKEQERHLKNGKIYGYTKTNCRLICAIYNLLKGVGEDYEVTFIAEALVAKEENEEWLGLEFFNKYIESCHMFDESTFGSNDENLSKGIRLKRTLEGRADHMFYNLQKSIKDRPNSKRAKMGFKITKDWVLEKLKIGFCEVTGLPFDIRGDNRSLFLPSVDRISNNKGYTPQNCQMVILAYNYAKGVNTHEDVMRLARALCEKKVSLEQP